MARERRKIADPPASSVDASSVPVEPSAAAKARWYANALLTAAFIFLLAAAVRTLHVTDVRECPLHAGDYIHMFDSRYYDQEARRIADGDIWRNDVYFLAPLYPFTLAIIYRFCSGSVHAAMYVQGVLGALSCALIYGVGRRLAGQAAGLVAGLTAALYGMFIFQEGLILATHLVLLLNMLCIWLLLRAAQGRSVMLWALAGLVLGLCMVAHGTALLLLPLIILWIIVDGRSPGVRACLARVAAVCLGAAVCVAPITIRNYVVGRDRVLLTSNAGLNFYIGNNANATGSYMHLTFDDLPGATLGWHTINYQRKPDDPKPSEISETLRNRAIADMKADPLRALGLFVKKARLFFNAVEVGINDQFYFHKRFSYVLRWPLPTFGLLAPIALTGLVCSLRRWRTFSLLYLWLAAQGSAFTLMFVLGRYRVVAVACLMVLAGFQIVWWGQALRARRYRSVGLSCIPLSLAIVLVHVPVAGFDRERGFGEQYRMVGEHYRYAYEDDVAIESYTRALEHDFEPWTPDARRFKCYYSLAKLYGREEQWYELIDAAKHGLELCKTLELTEQREEQCKQLAGWTRIARRKLDQMDAP